MREIFEITAHIPFTSRNSAILRDSKLIWEEHAQEFFIKSLVSVNASRTVKL